MFVNGSKILLLDTGSDDRDISVELKVPVTVDDTWFFFQLEWPEIMLSVPDYYAAVRHIGLLEGQCQPSGGALQMGQICTFTHDQCGFNLGEPVARWMPVQKHGNVVDYESAKNCPPFRRDVSASEKIAVSDPNCLRLKHLINQRREQCLGEACRLKANYVNFFPNQCDGEECAECEMYMCPSDHLPSVLTTPKGADIYYREASMYRNYHIYIYLYIYIYGYNHEYRYL